MRRLLITGMDGFTGRFLYAAALKLGFEVFSLKSDITDSKKLNIEVLELKPTHVAHLAAISSVTHEDHEAFYRVNVFGTLNLLSALDALTTKPKKILLSSSANVYGNVNNSYQISETICPQPVNHYAASKLVMEHMSRTYCGRLPITIVRPFNYTGVGHDSRFVVPKLVNHLRSGAAKINLGNLDVCREFNDVRMVCDAYLRLLASDDLTGTFNICTGRAYSLHQVLSLAMKIAGRSIEVSVEPAFIRTDEVHYLAGDPKKIESAIGFLKPYTLEQTLSWMLNG